MDQCQRSNAAQASARAPTRRSSIPEAEETRDNSAPDREAVVVGFERTGWIVTAAALLFAFAIRRITTSELIYQELARDPNASKSFSSA